MKISRTARGDETLELARDGILSASAGFMVKGRLDQTLDRRSMTRRIHRAFLDHVSLVGTPAYEGAKIMAFRNSADSPEALLPPLVTPRVDDWLNDPIHRWLAPASATIKP
jgi:phage head maturation protease